MYDISMILFCYQNKHSHLIAFTIVGTAFNLNIKKKNELINFAAGGFKDFTRIGSSDPKMWTDIFEDNKNNVLKSLEDYINNLEQIKHLIENDNFEEIESQLKSINYIKTILKGINQI